MFVLDKSWENQTIFIKKGPQLVIILMSQKNGLTPHGLECF